METTKKKKNETRLLTASFSADCNDFKKVRIIANSGNTMQFGNENVVIDLKRCKISTHTETPPLLASHDWERPIGHFESIEQTENDIIVNGVISCKNKDVENIKSSLGNGFPWQASLGFKVLAGEEYEQGETFEANGCKHKAENYTIVATAIEIWECSVVLFGADSGTAVVKANAQQLEQTENFHESEKENLNNMENENKQNEIEQTQTQFDAQAVVDKIREAELAELSRVSALKEISKKYDAEASLPDAITAGTTPNEYELNVLRASFNKAPAIQTTHNAGNNEKVFEALGVMEAGMNPSKHYNAQTIEQADKLRGRDLREVFEACSGYNPTYEQRRNGDLWVAGASTYNLSSILSNTANAILLQSFEESMQQWRNVFKVSVVNDFKTVDRYRLGVDAEFKQATNGGELEHITADDVKFQIQADVYGKQGELTYKDIVNGNALGVFAEMIRRFAFGANQAINKKCWSLFMNPNNCADNKAFYHADHGSLITSKALNASNLASVCATFQTRKKGYGVDKNELLGVRPTCLIVPPSLEYNASLLTKASLWSPADNQVSNYNPLANYGWQVISVPQLEDSTFVNYSASTWYVTCNPSQISAFEIAFLNGKQAPTIRQQDISIGRLGIGFDGHIDFGVAQEDYNGIIKVTA